ncbi:MAG: extracellular solute-binding protein [Alphaproteobacteria bacterium]|nr:extracellular solute-binding protein [Alphaproteobacteria bacterium]
MSNLVQAVRYSVTAVVSCALPVVVSAVFAAPVQAQGAETRHHALSLIGTPKYGPDFKHFDWVNPDAPKGGTVRINTVGDFNNLNPFTIKGIAASGMLLTYDTLMATSPDNSSTEYGLVAEWVSFPDDYSTATFGLRPEAKFHDGKPITPEDVIFSLQTLKKAHPHFGKYYKNVTKAEKTGDHQVTFTFDSKGNRELPQILGQLYILPKHYWQANGKNGTKRDLAKTTTEPPLTSGPYRVKSFDIGKTIVYERVADYWAKDLPVSRGQWNFDAIKYIYFKDRTGAFEEFKNGKADYWVENTSQAWATQFGFPAVKSGKVKKEEIATKRVAPMQAFVFNTRREKFKDHRVRQAFNYAFDFESLNKNILYNQYIRVGSYFDNSELKASGLPEGRELELLSEIKDEVPPEVFTTEFKNPVGGAQNMRENLRSASNLLKEAGWSVTDKVVADPNCGFFCKALKLVGLGSEKKERVLRNKAGEELAAEFMIASPAFERIILPYVADLKKLGVKASLRVVDPTQYEQRQRSYDFDIIVDTFSQSESPGNEQRDFWGSASADVPGSRNTIGIKNPAVDKLIDKIVFSKDRAELVAATRALDRVLLWNHYVVPQWHYPFERVAYWNKFDRPEKLPKQTPAFLQVWWLDPEKQKALGGGHQP